MSSHGFKITMNEEICLLTRKSPGRHDKIRKILTWAMATQLDKAVKNISSKPNISKKTFFALKYLEKYYFHTITYMADMVLYYNYFYPFT